MAIAASSTLFYIFVKSEPNNRRIDVAKEPPKSENELEEVREKQEDSETIEKDDTKANEIAFLERQSKLAKRVIGISLALMTGTLFSQFNTPVLYTHQQFNK